MLTLFLLKWLLAGCCRLRHCPASLSAHLDPTIIDKPASSDSPSLYTAVHCRPTMIATINDLQLHHLLTSYHVPDCSRVCARHLCSRCAWCSANIVAVARRTVAFGAAYAYRSRHVRNPKFGHTCLRPWLSHC
ncbi:uncharacterized protein K460DRAFT_68889 [Cucurbitaria berberidis CBS 394.84]|uniref:Secreted protein n=1 Tax=Cucurbitaria berberidis CBS 394.84 TaxID=1168544 RepID=A0A9P4GMA3_9PLEO|nr:uncharacterized protein K460DRAFT_68889 [Cucurbitaria berberidis CBS 394.84]KAF1848190.1 hypothetical protein K460DRAFT_68889 [Cucurbitaria berberidis CBS 394.84]